MYEYFVFARAWGATKYKYPYTAILCMCVIQPESIHRLRIASDFTSFNDSFLLIFDFDQL